jgi:tryptophanyl-tRNA synthetase
VLVECAAQLSAVARLPGIDGKAKMSKSLGNAISLCASPDDIRAAVKRMYTDEAHLRATDPGRVEGNVVFAFLDAFESDADRVAELKAHYRRGGLGDSVVKRLLDDRLQAVIAPIRAQRQRLANDRSAVIDILRDGTDKARQSAAETLTRAKHALGLDYFDQAARAFADAARRSPGAS